MARVKVQVEEFLQNPKGVKKSYLRVLFFYLIAIIGFSIFLGLTITYGPFASDTQHTQAFSVNLFENATLSNAATIISITGFCLMVFPFICLFSLWMIGINQVTKSAYFHLFLWLTCALLMILLLITLILFTRACIFNFASVYN